MAGDPAAEEKTNRRAAIEAGEAVRREAQRAADRGDRVSKLLDGWIGYCTVKRKNRPATLREVRRAAAVMRHHWGTRRITEVSRSDIKALVDRIGQDRAGEDGAPVWANRLFSFARSFFGWCLDHDIDGRPVLDASPAASIKRSNLFEEQARDRVLTDDEIRKLWNATVALGMFDRALRVLLLTGQRRREIIEMRWSELILDTATWTLPAARAKNKCEHTVPLSPAVLALLPDRTGTSDYVFTQSGRVPLSGNPVAKAKLDAAMGIEPWVVHDLRRSAATGMANLGIQPHVVEAVLNHKSGSKSGVAKIYNRAVYAAEKREALERWADHVAALVGANVVEFKRAAE